MSSAARAWAQQQGLPICDAHMHVFQLAEPVAQERIAAQVPDGEIDAYRTIAMRLGIRRAIVVQPSHFATDNRTTLAAVRSLGGEARAVVIPPAEASDKDIAQLDAQGAVAARFFLLRDTGLGVGHLQRLAQVIAPFGWHIELQCDGTRLPELLPVLERLPVASVVDHLGRMPKGTSADGALFRGLVRHVSSGRGWVKLSAPYHNSRDAYVGFADIRPQVEALARAAPERLVWASNWPHVQFGDKPDDLELGGALLELLPDAALARRVLADNAAALYRFG